MNINKLEIIHPKNTCYILGQVQNLYCFHPCFFLSLPP